MQPVYFVVVLLAAGVVAAVVAGLIARRRAMRRRRLEALLAPLAATVDGRIEREPGAVWLSGTWDGTAIRIRIRPDMAANDAAGQMYRFTGLEIYLLEQPGDLDWTAERVPGPAGHRPRWVVHAAETALRGRLEGSGLIATLQRNDRARRVSLSATGGALYYLEDVRPDTAPSVETLRARLAFLVGVAELNRRLNAVPRRDS